MFLQIQLAVVWSLPTLEVCPMTQYPVQPYKARPQPPIQHMQKSEEKPLQRNPLSTNLKHPKDAPTIWNKNKEKQKYRADTINKLCWDSNPRPQNIESRPKTTRPGLPSNKSFSLHMCLLQNCVFKTAFLYKSVFSTNAFFEHPFSLQTL